MMKINSRNVEICKCDSSIQKGFENSSTKSSTSFVDMRYMQNNGKNFEMLFDDQVITKKWLTGAQHGFRSKRSTTTSLLEFYEMVTETMDR